MTHPRYFNDWDILRDVARAMLALRAKGFPAQIAKAAMTQAQADDRLRLADAQVRLWTHVVDRTPFDTADPIASLGASWLEMRADIAAAVERADAQAARRPADQSLRDYADGLRAIAAQLAPVDRPRLDQPHIVFCHDFNLRLRESRQAPQAKAA